MGMRGPPLARAICQDDAKFIAQGAAMIQGQVSGPSFGAKFWGQWVIDHPPHLINIC
jgi:hypothetical protein